MTTPSVRSDGRPVSKERLEAAAEQGRRLAARGVADAQAVFPAENPVEGLARAGMARLREMGVVTEVVRARRGCLVVRTTPRVEGYEAEACALVHAWLGALPAAVYGVPGTVAESSCGSRGGRACMHTLMWQEPAGIRRLPMDPPSNAADGTPDGVRPPQSGGALPAPSPGAANPTPIPIPAADGTVPAAPPPSPAWQLAPPGMSLAPVRRQPVPSTMPVVAPLPLPALWPLPAPRLDAAPPNDGASTAPSGTQTEIAPGTGTGTGTEAAATGTGTGADGVGTSKPAPEPADVGTVRAGGRRWLWLRRRAWLVVVGLLAGCLGGFVAAGRGGTAYSATSVLVVQATGSTAATSSANGAEELAVTYAALIPDDEAMLRRVATELGVSQASVARGLTVQSEAGTALVDIRFTAPSPVVALHGANDVARLLSSAEPPGRAIAAGSVAVVSPADAAARAGTLHELGFPLGVLGGLAVGAGAALVAERTDRRIDDLNELGGAADCSATMVPGGLTMAELARSLQRSGAHGVTVVPMRSGQCQPAHDLARALREAWPITNASEEHSSDRPDVLVSPAFADSPQSVTAGSGQTVLVVGAGERVPAVREVGERLRVLGRGPAWAVLVTSDRTRPDGRGR